MKHYTIKLFKLGGALIVENGKRIIAYITNTNRARLLCAYLNGEL